ncbi:FG-GAP-like repeat-containing protein [Arthrobacter sp. MDT3-44]
MTTSDGTVQGNTQIFGSAPRNRAFNIVLLAEGFTAGQQANFNTACTEFVTAFSATAPFDGLASAINVFRVNVASTDSGADDPAAAGGTGAVVRTYFDATFGGNNIRRLLLCNTTTALQVAAAQVPEFTVVLVVVNSTIYGGAGGSVGTYSLASGATEIAIHELGHTAFGLADEYDYYAGGAETGHDHHPPVEPSEPNVTVDANRATLKWRWAVNAATALPTTANPDCTTVDPQPSPVPAGTVGAFEGAHYYHCGAFRPEYNCKMRSLGDPFCLVCSQVIRNRIGSLGHASIVGFGDAGVWVSLNNGNGTFKAPVKVVDNFAYSAGGWRVEKHPRFLADVTGDGRADIVGFGDAGVWVSLNNGNGTFKAPAKVVDNFAYSAGGWWVEKHPRFLADVTGDGRADIVGFGDAGVWVSLNNGNGTFRAPAKVVDNLAYSAGGWRVEKHPRFLADVTGDGRADIVGFGDAGVWVSLNNGNGTFKAPAKVVDNFAYSAGGWRVEKHPRFLADVTGDGRADIVGFGDAGVWVSLNNGNGTFRAPVKVVDNFAYSAGGWRVEKHPRFLADVTGDGRADIVGFGDAGVWVSLNNGNGTFKAPAKVVDNFAYSAGGWRVEKHPRFLADVTGDGRADIVGFGDAGVWVSLNNGDGTFKAPAKVVDNFAYSAGGWRVEKHPRFLADIG